MKRNAQSELSPNEAVLRIVDLRHDLEQEMTNAAIQAEVKVRQRFAAKEKALMERVSPGFRVTVEKRVEFLLRQEGGEVSTEVEAP